jgi:hypothetical protein
MSSGKIKIIQQALVFHAQFDVLRGEIFIEQSHQHANHCDLFYPCKPGRYLLSVLPILSLPFDSSLALSSARCVGKIK